jgi:hypothetical protein
MKNYRAGLVLEFHKATRKIGKSEALEVVTVDKDKLLARKHNGEEVTLTRRQAQAFSVMERNQMEVAPGDKLLLEANRREKGFRATNGELVTVARVEQGRIELEDGRTLPAHYQQFDYGYAVTAHRSQGKTVDAVIVSGDRMSQELFYVAASRGRESLTVITSDKEQFQQSIGISGERTSATELARKAELEVRSHRLPDWSVENNLESARHWALWQSAATALEPHQPIPEQEVTIEPRQEKEQKQEKVIDYGYGFGM